MSLKKKIFITGATSEIISKWIDLIDLDLYELWALTRNKEKRSNSKISNWIEGSLEAIDKIENIPHFDICIHAAAITHTFSEKTYLALNFEATKKLVALANAKKCELFVYISSRTASLESEGYGKSKFLAETYIKENTNNWLIYRPSEIFGGSKNEAINELIQNTINKNFVVCPVGIKYKLFPLHIDNCAHLLNYFTFEIKKSNEIITLNGNEGYSFVEIVKLVAEIFNKKTTIVPVPKFILFVIYYILKIFNIKIGLVPDQIPRLYSKKETQFWPLPQISLKEYILSLASK